MTGIFISYRRDDTEGQAGRLFDDLVKEFGDDSVFIDVTSIAAGRDFRRVIDQQVSSCDVLLAIIGKQWLSATNETGERRIDVPTDFVCLEIAAALKRDIPVIPILVQKANIPSVDQLPPELADLAYRNGLELTHARWDSDVQVLIKALRASIQSNEALVRTKDPQLQKIPGSSANARDSKLPIDLQSVPKLPFQRHYLLTILAALFVVIAVVFWYKFPTNLINREPLTDMAAEKTLEERVAAEKVAAEKKATEDWTVDWQAIMEKESTDNDSARNNKTDKVNSVSSHASRGWLGVQIQDVTRELAESFGMKKPQGALVSKVETGSPAEKAQLQIGDIITEFNGQPIETSGDLPSMVGVTPINDKATLKIIRQGDEKTINFNVGLFSEQVDKALKIDKQIEKAADTKTEKAKPINRLGLSVIDLTAEERETLQVVKNGVLVQNVSKGAAKNAGIQPGDVILRINNDVTPDIADFEKKAKNLPVDKVVSFLIQRRNSPVFLALKIDK